MILGEGKGALWPKIGRALPASPDTNLPRVVQSVGDPAEVIAPSAPEPTAAGLWGWGGGPGVGAVEVRGTRRGGCGTDE